MDTNHHVTLEIPPQIDELHEIKNEPETSPQGYNVMDATTASQNQSSDEKIVENKTSSPQVEAEIETRKTHFKLYLSALKGDWNTAERIYKEDKIDLTVKLSKRGDTALHIAVAAQRTSFVKKLVEQMKKEDLAIKNNAGNSAFFVAAESHSVEIVKAMMEKNEDIVKVRGDNDMLPLHKAALTGDKVVVEYLYEATKDELLDNNDRFELLVNLINHGLYAVALDLVELHPEIATMRGKNEKTALHYLARMPVPTPIVYGSPWKRLVIYTFKEAIRTVERLKDREEQYKDSFRNRKKKREKRWRKSVSLRAQIDELISRSYFLGAETPQAAIELTKSLWNQVILLDDSQILNIIRKPWPLIFEAAKQGNLMFLNIILGAYPDLVFEVDENHYSIFHFAVMYRQLNIFKIIYDIGSFKDLLVQNTDEKGNNILHLAAKLPGKDMPDRGSGEAALQLKKESLWFKRVKEILHPWDAEAKNREGKTARAIFIEQHQVLRNRAEKWISDMVHACLMGAAIIATVVFGAAFTVPGGTNEETGTPNLVRRASFIIFAISDAIALLLSCFSILKFLSVIHSRYREEDFISRLLSDMHVGLRLFSLSVDAMMVVFCATMFIVFRHGMLWPPILMTTMAVFACFIYWERLQRAVVDVPHPTIASDRSPFKEEK